MSLWTDLWELFFPRCCVVCGRRLSQTEEHLCLRCLSALPRTELHRYPDNPMEKNLWGKLPLCRAAAYLHYAKGGDVRKVLFALKYGGNHRLGVFLGRCMATELQSSGFFRDIDFIVPVPLHRSRLRRRGYNQSEMLALGLSQVTGIPVSLHLLERRFATVSQTTKSRYSRWMNMHEVFGCVAPETLAGKHVLLVDDVMTTGATLVSCADALSVVPRLRLSILTLALAGQS